MEKLAKAMFDPKTSSRRWHGPEYLDCQLSEKCAAYGLGVVTEWKEN